MHRSDTDAADLATMRFEADYARKLSRAWCDVCGSRGCHLPACPENTTDNDDEENEE